MTIRERASTARRRLERKLNAAYLGQGKPLTPAEHAQMAQLIEAQELSDAVTVLSADFQDAKRTHDEKVTLAGVRERRTAEEPQTGFRQLSEDERRRKELYERQGAEKREAEKAAEAAEHQRRWQKERKRIEEAQASIRREAMLAGQPVPDLVPPPSTPPAWFSQQDGVRYVKIERETYVNPDGTRTLHSDHDLISGRPGNSQPPALTPEQRFQAEAAR